MGNFISQHGIRTSTAVFNHPQPWTLPNNDDNPLSSSSFTYLRLAGLRRPQTILELLLNLDEAHRNPITFLYDTDKCFTPLRWVPIRRVAWICHELVLCLVQMSPMHFVCLWLLDRIHHLRTWSYHPLLWIWWV